MSLVSDFRDLASQIKREGITELMEWVEASDFYTAPASTKYHGADEGGLLFHSLNVHDALALLCDQFVKENEEIAQESIKICALFHDLCKANYYSKEKRNKKINGSWEEITIWGVKDQLPMGHGEKSVYIINKFMKLSDEEALAIRWHLGTSDPGAYFFWPSGEPQKQAFRQYPLVSLLHTADILASYRMDEWEE
jgi:hypothetical protein